MLSARLSAAQSSPIRSWTSSPLLGLKKPDISILSEEFLAEVRGLPQKNVAVELLRKLLNDEIRPGRRQRLVQSRSFGRMLEETIHRYKNRAIETVEIIEELITWQRNCGKQIKEARISDSQNQNWHFMKPLRSTIVRS